MPDSSQLPPSRPAASLDGTREKLITVALRLFAERGFEATSTRDIASAAKANIGSIAYHFGGKEGLRMACAASIVDRLSAIAAAAEQGWSKEPSPLEAADRLETLIRTIFTFMVANPESQPIAAFLLREMAHPSDALEKIYAELIEPLHIRLCRLWGTATGTQWDDPQTPIDVFAMIGQAIYFRIGRPIVTRRMDWESIGQREADIILPTLILNLRAQITARREAAA